MSGAENGAERAENRVERSGSERGAGGRGKNDGAGAERGTLSTFSCSISKVDFTSYV